MLSSMIVRRLENTPLASVTQEDQKKYGHLIADPFGFINDEFEFAASLLKPGAGADAQLALGLAAEVAFVVRVRFCSATSVT